MEVLIAAYLRRLVRLRQVCLHLIRIRLNKAQGLELTLNLGHKKILRIKYLGFSRSMVLNQGSFASVLCPSNQRNRVLWLTWDIKKCVTFLGQ